MAKTDPLRDYINKIAADAANLHIENGMDPSMAISKFASQIPNDEFLGRIVEETNQNINAHQFATQMDKRAEFDIAKSASVREILSRKPKSHEKVASVWLSDLPATRTFTKNSNTASTVNKYGSHVDEFGLPEVDHRPSVGIGKEALEQMAGNSEHLVKSISEEIRQLEFEKKAEFMSAYRDLKSFIKSAVDRGESLTKTAVTIACALPVNERADASAMIDSAVTDLVGSHAIKTAEYNEYLTKTASVDLNHEGYPIFRGGDSLVIKLHTCLGYDKESMNDPGNMRTARPGDGHAIDTVDQTMPYEIKAIGKPLQARPALVKGKFFS